MPVKFLRLWIGLLFLSGAIATVFLNWAVKDTWRWLQLDAEVPIQILSLSVKEIKPHRFGIEADYSYVIDGVSYNKKTWIKSKIFLNPLAAETFKNAIRKHPRTGWYSLQDKEFSSLERELPLKSYLHFLITLSVFIYFCYAKNFTSQLRFFGTQRR